MRRNARHVFAMPSPNDSRRCVVTSSSFDVSGRLPDQLADLGAGAALDVRTDPVDRVDHGVARDVHGVHLGALASQVLGRVVGRREVQVRHPAHDDAVHLLGERLLQVARAQPGLDVPDADLVVERAGGGDHGRGRVAMHEHQVRLGGGQHRVELLVQAGGQLGQ